MLQSVLLSNHFGWVRSHCSNEMEKKLVQRYIPNHYCALLHSDIVIKGGKVGTSSVTSIDIHDIARSAKTYGIENYFIVTPLIDQQNIVKTILGFWDSSGIAYNKDRSNAVGHVRLAESLSAAVEEIEKKEGKKPLIIGTSAQHVPGVKNISYYDQKEVWQKNRPVLFIFGTAQGICSELMQRCDYVLGPLEGFSDFNHLSVRSAAAIIFDRWLGSNSAGQ